MPCVQVDGNDIFATVYAMKQAMEYTRKHGKPYFIEMVTYRLADHTTADDAKRYREDAEVESWRRKDPIIRLNAHLKNLRIWDDDKEVALKEKVALDIAAAVARAENITPPERTDAFDNMYAETPADLALQRDTRHTHSLGQDPSQLPIEAQERAAQMDAAAFAAHAAH